MNTLRLVRLHSDALTGKHASNRSACTDCHCLPQAPANSLNGYTDMRDNTIPTLTLCSSFFVPSTQIICCKTCQPAMHPEQHWVQSGTEGHKHSRWSCEAQSCIIKTGQRAQRKVDAHHLLILHQTAESAPVGILQTDNGRCGNGMPRKLHQAPGRFIAEPDASHFALLNCFLHGLELLGDGSGRVCPAWIIQALAKHGDVSAAIMEAVANQSRDVTATHCYMGVELSWHVLLL